MDFESKMTYIKRILDEIERQFLVEMGSHDPEVIQQQLSQCMVRHAQLFYPCGWKKTRKSGGQKGFTDLITVTVFVIVTDSFFENLLEDLFMKLQGFSLGAWSAIAGLWYGNPYYLNESWLISDTGDWRTSFFVHLDYIQPYGILGTAPTGWHVNHSCKSLAYQPLCLLSERKCTVSISSVTYSLQKEEQRLNLRDAVVPVELHYHIDSRT